MSDPKKDDKPKEEARAKESPLRGKLSHVIENAAEQARKDAAGNVNADIEAAKADIRGWGPEKRLVYQIALEEYVPPAPPAQPQQ